MARRNRGVFLALLIAATLYGFSFYNLGFPILTTAESARSQTGGVLTYAVYLGISAIAGYLLGSARFRPMNALWKFGYLSSSIASLGIGLAYLFHLSIPTYYVVVSVLGAGMGAVETFEPTLVAALAGTSDLSTRMGWLSVSRAVLCHPNVKSSEDTVAKSLEGDYRPEHLFAVRQSLTAYRYYQQLVAETDAEIQRQLGELKTTDTTLAQLPKRTKLAPYQRQGNEPWTFDLRSELYRIFGIDLTNVPGISTLTAQTILSEVGTDVSRFQNAAAFASWLGLCPEKKISGGKVLFTKSRRVRSRAATALRMAAQSLHHAKDYLGEFFQRVARKLGKPQAITATAHKLARIIFHLLSTKQAYDESVFHKCEEENRKRVEQRLRKQAATLGFQIIPADIG